MAVLYPPGYVPPTTVTPGAVSPVGIAGILPALRSPALFLKGALETPTIAAGAPAAVVFKSITKATGLRAGSALLGVGGGLVLGSLLTGGGKQEQKQTAAQKLQQRQEQRQRASIDAMLKEFKGRIAQKAEARAAGAAEATIGITPTIAPTYDIVAGGNVEIGGITTQTDTATTTINVTGLTQEQYSAQIGQLLTTMQTALQSAKQQPIITQTQEARQEGGTNWALLAVVAVLGAMFIFKRKKHAG